MRPNPYESFRGRELTLNDHLAIDRTVLANERTALAYARTVLGMLAVGGSAIKFFQSPVVVAIGVVFVAMSLVVGAVGWYRFMRTRRFLRAALRGREE